MKTAVVSALVAMVALTAAPVSAQTIYIVRHAERADASADSALSDQGQARGQALAERLDGAGVSHVLVTPYRRTTDTAAATAMAAEVTPLVIPIPANVADHAALVSEAARAVGPGAVVLIVGHSNTVPEIARVLGDPEPEMLEDCAFDRLVVIDLDGVEPMIAHERYGGPSAC